MLRIESRWGRAVWSMAMMRPSRHPITSSSTSLPTSPTLQWGFLMLLPDARAAIVTTCKELSRTGLVVGTAGNVSVRDGDLVAVTPSGVRYAELTPELVGVHRLDGAAVEAPLAPTSELPLHLAIYTDRPEVGAVVHTHSLAATALSTLVDEVPAGH